VSMSDARDAARLSREIVAEAAAWITRLHSSRRTPELDAAFRSWLAADEKHARAFEGMTEIWDMTPAVSAGEMPRVTVREERASRSPWVRAAAVVIVCAAATFVGRWYWSDAGYTTEIGEQRIVNLQDGTRVSMNAGTRLAVDYSETERRIVLREGEAFFEVAHNLRAPFVVIAGDHRVIAVGTAFDVRQDPKRTAVTLVEGTVTVAPVSAASALEPRRLTGTEQQQPKVDDRRVAPQSGSSFSLSPGQRLILAAARPPQLDTPSVAVVTAWRRGEVILDETLLSDAVAEMNRYDRTPIVIDDARIAQLPVSGIYRTGDSRGFANIVARMYGLGVVQDEGRIHLREAADQTSN
jgi:transmembrane sensor